MARYNQVKIGSIYLTHNGLVGGKPCKITVPGLNRLMTSMTGQIISSADGTPYAQLIDVDNRGAKIEVISEWMDKTVFNSIVALHEASKNNGTTIALEIIGDTGTFNKNVIPTVPDDIIDPEGFSNNIIKKAGFRYTVT